MDISPVSDETNSPLGSLEAAPPKGASGVRMAAVSWLFIALLACGIAILVAAEWPRLSERAGLQARERRSRARRKANLKLLRTETDDFAASVQRDLERLPTIEERDSRR
jgi:hypothetical protein